MCSNDPNGIIAAFVFSVAHFGQTINSSESEIARAKGLSDAVRYVRDFSRIKVAPDFDDPFSPALSQLLFAQSVAWLDECFSRPLRVRRS